MAVAHPIYDFNYLSTSHVEFYPNEDLRREAVISVIAPGGVSNLNVGFSVKFLTCQERK